MQKHASNFDIVYQEIHTGGALPIYFDKEPVYLPDNPVSFLHYHDRLEIGICKSGTGVFYNYNYTEAVNEGDIILFFSGDAHYSQSLEPLNPCICRFVYVDSEALLLQLFNSTQVNHIISNAMKREIPSIIRENEQAQIHKILKALLFDIFEENPSYVTLTALHLAEFLIKAPQIFTLLKKECKTVHSLDNDWVSTASDYIASHYTENVTSLTLSEICFISESQLRRRFKEKYGVSPMKYLHTLRCNIAARLLIHTSLSVAETSYKVGYADVTEFYRHFVSIYGQAPSHYRQTSKRG